MPLVPNCDCSDVLREIGGKVKEAGDSKKYDPKLKELVDQAFCALHSQLRVLQTPTPESPVPPSPSPSSPDPLPSFLSNL
jgi:hypothetical protein